MFSNKFCTAASMQTLLRVKVLQWMQALLTPSLHKIPVGASSPARFAASRRSCNASWNLTSSEFKILYAMKHFTLQVTCLNHICGRDLCNYRVKADASRQRHREDDDDWGNGRAVREYIEALETNNVSTTRKLSPTDPAASYTAAPGGPAFYAYSTNYLIDTNHGIIMDVEPSTANRTPEADTTKTMIERVEDRFGIKPKRLIGDTAYGTAAMLNWIFEQKQIEPHTPLWEKAERQDGTYGRSDFIWDAEADFYRCPAGKLLQRYRRKFKKKRTGINKDNHIRYSASRHDCDACEYKPRCCPNVPCRKVTRSRYESSRDVARAVAQTPAYKKTRRQRKKVEMLFAHMKRISKMDRLRLRGMSGAHDEFLLTATVQNLRRMAKLLSQPPPDHRIDAPA